MVNVQELTYTVVAAVLLLIVWCVLAKYASEILKYEEPEPMASEILKHEELESTELSFNTNRSTTRTNDLDEYMQDIDSLRYDHRLYTAATVGPFL